MPENLGNSQRTSGTRRTNPRLVTQPPLGSSDISFGEPQSFKIKDSSRHASRNASEFAKGEGPIKLLINFEDRNQSRLGLKNNYFSFEPDNKK